MTLNVTYGVSTWLWDSPFQIKTTNLFPKIKAMGFDSVEIPIEDPALIDVEKVKTALNDNDLTAVICGAFGPSRDLTHEDKSYHQTCFDYLEKCFQISSELGSKFVAGPMYSAVGKARLVSPEQRNKEWDLAVKNLQKVCEMASKAGQYIALESLNRFETDLVNTVDDIINLIQDINHPNAKILLDGFHLSIEEKSLEEAVKKAGDKLIHVQVSENHRGIPGTGQTNWESFKRGLEAVEYSGCISIESFTPEVKELAGAVCIWKPFAPTQDIFAEQGLAFMKNWIGN